MVDQPLRSMKMLARGVELGAGASVRISSKRALMAVAHSLLIVAYVLIKPGCIYEDLDFKALGTR
jgi:hypothetical protein